MLHSTFPYIAVLKLPSGEELIGKIVSKTMTEYVVNKPLVLVNTQQGVQFAPLMLMADQSSDIILRNVCAEATPVKQLETDYQSAVSGIALPPSAGSFMRA